VLPNGSFYAAGRSAGRFALARYVPNGNLDEGFGQGGKVTADIDSDLDDDARNIAIQSDGCVVLIGTSGRDVAMVRYDPTGKLVKSITVKNK
jgi:hypothetical protein